MANNYPPLPDGYTKARVHLLKTACEYYYPIGVFGDKDQRAFGQGKFGPWQDSGEFKKELFEIFPDIEDITKIHEILQQWEIVAPEEIKPPEQPSQTTPEKEKLEQLQKEAGEREQAIKEANERAKQKTEQQINTLQEKFKSKVVYLEPKNPTEIKLSPEEEFARSNFEKAAQNSPETFIKTFSEKVVQTLPQEIKNQLTPEELKTTSEQVAIDFLNRIVKNDNLKNIPAGIFKSLLESGSVQTELKKEALPVLAALSSTSEGVVRSFLYPLIGKNLTDYYYQEPEKEFVVTNSPTPNSTYKVDLNQLKSDFSTFAQNPIFEHLKNQAKDELLKHGKSIASDIISKASQKGLGRFLKNFVSSSALNTAFQSLSGAGVTYQATNITGWVIQVAAPDIVPIVTFAAQRFGINVGLTAVNALTPAATTVLETGAIAGATATGEVAATAIAGTVAAEATGAAAATATAAAGTAVGAGAGAAAGTTLGALTGPLAPLIIPIATAIGAVLGKIVDKIKIFLKRNPNAIRYATLLPLVVGIATGSVVFIAVGGVLFIGTFVVTGGVATAASAAGGFLVSTIAIVTGATLKSIAKPLVLSLIGTVAFCALVFFIINSGAYIVPPDTGSINNTIDQNPYISVSKVADITTAPNPNPTLTVNYTVTVSAPQGSITNIVFQNGCSVIKSGSTPTCNAPLPSETPSIIDPTSPFTFTYSQTYDSSYSNSLVTDTFSVTATTPQGQGTSLSSASVVIGNPPTSCFNVAGSNWPVARKANILAAIASLSGSYPAYTAKLCSGGTINVIYDTSKNPGGWGYYSGGTLYFNGRGGLDSVTNALYILAHETGHHFQSSTASGIAAMVQYLNNTAGVATERPLCSYVNTGNPYEAFAEAIALYVTHDQSSQWTGYCGGTFQSTYPNHYNFVKNNIF